MEEPVKTFDNPVKISEWFNDSLGNRIQKTSGTSITKYIVDPNRALSSVLAETNSSGAITAYYVYGLGLISKIQGTSGYFYQYDGLGSTVAITDKTGAIKNKYAYDDFGNLATNSTESIANPFKYVGRYGVMTDLNDLLYMRARFYMPSVGRFVNKDPIGFLDKFNLYTYGWNNPLRFIDPSGLITWPYSWKGWVGVILTGAGGTMMATGVGGPAGLILFRAGLVITAWDTVEGVYQAWKIGRVTGQKILERDKEEWEEIDKELEINKRICR